MHKTTMADVNEEEMTPLERHLAQATRTIDYQGSEKQKRKRKRIASRLASIDCSGWDPDWLHGFTCFREMLKTFDIVLPWTSRDAKKVQDLLVFNEVVRVRTAVTAVTAVTVELPRWANMFSSLVLSHPLVVRERKAIKLYHATKLLAWGKLLHDQLGRDNVISKSCLLGGAEIVAIVGWIVQGERRFPKKELRNRCRARSIAAGWIVP